MAGIEAQGHEPQGAGELGLPHHGVPDVEERGGGEGAALLVGAPGIDEGEQGYAAAHHLEKPPRRAVGAEHVAVHRPFDDGELIASRPRHLEADAVVVGGDEARRRLDAFPLVPLEVVGGGRSQAGGPGQRDGDDRAPQGPPGSGYRPAPPIGHDLILSRARRLRPGWRAWRAPPPPPSGRTAHTNRSASDGAGPVSPP